MVYCTLATNFLLLVFSMSGNTFVHWNGKKKLKHVSLLLDAWTLYFNYRTVWNKRDNKKSLVTSVLSNRAGDLWLSILPMDLIIVIDSKTINKNNSMRLFPDVNKFFSFCVLTLIKTKVNLLLVISYGP